MRLLRLSNSLSAALLVLIGAWLTVGWPLPWRAWQAATAMWCVTAFGYVSNDYVDGVEDRINKPDRPLPSGAVHKDVALVLALVLGSIALVLSIGLGWREALVALTVLGLLTLYNGRLKSSAGGGNLLIALLAGCTLLTGSVAALGFGWPAIQLLWAPAATLATFIGARELLKTIEDLAGDQQAHKLTAAVHFGSQTVLRWIAVLTLLAIACSLVPVAVQSYSLRYLAVIALGVHAPLLYTVYQLRQKVTPQRVSHCLALLKGSYFAGLLALLLA